MNINVYLPNELGAEAKRLKLPLSQLLRAAVESAIKTEEALTKKFY